MTLINLPPNKFQSKSLDKGIDVFAPKYRACSKRYIKQGLKRWLKEHPDADIEDYECDPGIEFVDTL